MKREASVAGSFYPAQCNEIESMINQYNQILNQALKNSIVLELKPKAIISPHAGYVYSGFTANVAHRILGNSKPKRVVVIGPSHRVYLDGISGSFYDYFETPCGDLEIDKEYLEHLRSLFDIKFIEAAHQEHSTEVQMPFIKHYIPDAKVIEMVYGDMDPFYLSKICEAILSDKDNAIVISTDLSHYYPLKEAEKLDTYCLKAVHDLDTTYLHSGCEACGKIGVEAIILAAKNLGLKSKIIDYRTSADASGDESAVVGYMSAIFL
ncbi:AmmeMemoRadiSam system protein B [Nitrosophilus kaiyonis]|uniref:AmmeMemoRadiSam system protein B n=1 Tax=Nitrosophilus kaiyonis TaxID=2930200 RepID=UPI002490BAFA|nr:AmmeMemoRadiSam system protein B [Nitrosophilus kaiyonis]